MSWTGNRMAQSRLARSRMAQSRMGRWLVPVAGLALVGGVWAGTHMTSAQAAPSLPEKTPAQLLAWADAQSQVPAFTGTVLESTSLGLPRLPGSQNSRSLVALLSGSHTLQVWYASPQRFR